MRIAEIIPAVQTSFMDNSTRDALAWLLWEFPDESIYSLWAAEAECDMSGLARRLRGEYLERRTPVGVLRWRATRRRSLRRGYERDPSERAVCEALYAVSMEAYLGWGL